MLVPEQAGVLFELDRRGPRQPDGALVHALVVLLVLMPALVLAQACDWGVDDKTGLPQVFCRAGRPGKVNVWSGLPATASEFCVDCGQGAQLADGSYVFIVAVRFGPSWLPDDHTKVRPCCNNSVVAFTSDEGQRWRFTSVVADDKAGTYEVRIREQSPTAAPRSPPHHNAKRCAGGAQ